MAFQHGIWGVLFSSVLSSELLFEPKISSRHRVVSEAARRCPIAADRKAHYGRRIIEQAPSNLALRHARCSNAARNQRLHSALAIHRDPILFRPTNSQQFEAAPCPENFPLGSPASGAAARAMLRRIQSDQEQHVTLVAVEHIGRTEPTRTTKVYAHTRRVNR
jgi:hypothetical protein